MADSNQFSVFRCVAWALLLALVLGYAAMGEMTASQATTNSTDLMPAQPVSPPATAVAPRHLQSIRVRPLGEALRVILALDGPAPYTVRNGASGQAFVDLLNVQVDYLPPELAQLHDPRLQGIWLAARQPGLATLELRLPGPTIHIEHFALNDPATIVLDLTRSDQPVANLQITPKNFDLSAGAPGDAPPDSAPAPQTTPQPSSALPPVPVEVAMQKGGSALPVAWIENPVLPAPKVVAPMPLPETAAPTEPAKQPAASAPPNAASLATSSTMQTASPPVAEDVHPINRDFDDFPIDSLDVIGPQPKAIRQEFLNRRWSSVISDGLDFLKEKRINRDTVPVLYMMAEARYQLGREQATQPLNDMINFYQQAMRTDDSGELGAFGGMRLSEMLLKDGDAGGALAMAKKGLGSADTPLHRRAAIQVARAQAAAGQTNQALATLATLQQMPGLDMEDQLKLKLFEAGIRQSHNDSPGAWQAYQQASKIDPDWTNVNSEDGQLMARAALASGHAAEARKEIEYLNRMFSFSDDGEKVNLALLYAQALEASGDERTAEETYAVLLNGLGDTAKGREVQKLMAQMHPDDLLVSQGRYARLLFRRGKLRDAMAELHRSYEAALRNGIDTAPLDDVAQLIVPPFMADAVQQQRPFEAVQAWRLYSDKLRDLGRRAKCLPPLGAALASMGLNADAQRVVEMRDAAGEHTPDLTRLKATLCLNRGAGLDALTLLRPLASDPADNAPAATLRLMAQAGEAANRKLDAAQAWQALARQRGLTSDERGSALLKSGNLFLDQSMPQQSVEIGLTALLDEREQLKDETRKPWSSAISNDLVLMLARAYAAEGDANHAQLVLQELLARPWQNPDQTAQARWLLAQVERRQGNAQGALDTLKTLDADNAASELWHTAAQQARAVSDWNTQHPAWAVDTDSASQN